jgi:hypothetical protein
MFTQCYLELPLHFIFEVLLVETCDYTREPLITIMYNKEKKGNWRKEGVKNENPVLIAKIPMPNQALIAPTNMPPIIRLFY